MFFISINLTNETIIGNYSDVINMTNCGISRKSLMTEHNCFKWHKNSLPELQYARNVTPGEAPWTVLCRIYVIIGGQTTYVLIDFNSLYEN